MSALPLPRFQGATAFDVAVISHVLCLILSTSRHTQYHKEVRGLMKEMAITCDGLMEVVGCSPETLDPLTRMILDYMAEAREEIFEDFAERLRNDDPILRELIRRYPLMKA